VRVIARLKTLDGCTGEMQISQPLPVIMTILRQPFERHALEELPSYTVRRRCYELVRQIGAHTWLYQEMWEESKS